MKYNNYDHYIHDHHYHSAQRRPKNLARPSLLHYHGHGHGSIEAEEEE